MNARKLAADRESFNDWVWEKVIVQSHKMFRNRKGWWFHHKIRTDGVAVSILFSREAAFKADKSIKRVKKTNLQQQKSPGPGQ